MKKFVLLMAFMAISSFSFAQTFTETVVTEKYNRCNYYERPFSWGPKVAFNAAGLYNVGATKSVDMRLGVAAGLFAAYRFSDAFALQTEVMWSQQGVRKINNFQLFGTYYPKIYLDYINVPVLAKFYVVQGLNFEVGPQVAFNVNAKEKVVDRYNRTSKESISSYVNSVNLNFVGGVAYDFDFGLILGARYNIAATPAFKDTDSQGRIVKGYNHLVQISAAYKF